MELEYPRYCHFFDKFITVDLSDDHNNKLVKDEATNTGEIEENVSSIEFIRSLKDNRDDIISASVLYNQFLDWCQQNKKRECSNTLFGTQINSHIKKTRKSSGLFYDLKTIQ